MMKEVVTTQLGSQLGRYIKVDTRYPGYMRVRVEFPLVKPLMPSIIVRITVRYENVPHFCFTCDRLGHVAINCDEEEKGEGGCHFVEELMASLPKRVREISIKAAQSRIVKPLFQVGVDSSKATTSGSKSESASHSNDKGWGIQEEDLEGNMAVSDDFVQSIKAMHVSSNVSKGSWPMQGHGGKDRESVFWNKHVIRGGNNRKWLSDEQGIYKHDGNQEVPVTPGF
jgi:hypothetical protein